MTEIEQAQRMVRTYESLSIEDKRLVMEVVDQLEAGRPWKQIEAELKAAGRI